MAREVVLLDGFGFGEELERLAFAEEAVQENDVFLIVGRTI